MLELVEGVEGGYFVNFLGLDAYFVELFVKLAN